MNNNVDDVILQKLRATVKEGCVWVVYANVDLGSSGCGHQQFLLVGPGCTYLEHPPALPDTKVGLGWRYRPQGVVNLESGVVEGFSKQGTLKGEPNVG